MARIKDTSVEAVKAAADFVDVVEERTQLRKAGGRYIGPLPVPRGAHAVASRSTPSTSSTTASAAAQRGDLITFVRETRGARLRRRDRVARRAVPHPDRVRGELARAGRGAHAARAAATRCSTRRRRSTSATLWDTEAGGMARDYLKGRGLERGDQPRVPARPRARRQLARAQGDREGLHAATSCAPPGSTRQRGDDYFQRRLLFPLADARRAGCSASRRASCTRTTRCKAKYVNTPESELFHKGWVVYGLDKARAAIAREDRACVVEGNTDVIALRQAGFEPVVASHGHGAHRAAAAASSARLTKRLWLAFDGDAAGETATLRGMELAAKQRLRREGRRAAAGRRPRRRPARVRAAARARRAVRRLPRADRDRARRRPRGRRSAP